VFVARARNPWPKEKPFVEAAGFSGRDALTYPVGTHTSLDCLSQLLIPAKVEPLAIRQ